MEVLTAEVFFNLQDGQRDAETVLDSLIDQLQQAKRSASHGELHVGSGGIVDHPQDPDLLGGQWWVDATEAMFKQRFEPIEIDGIWHVLDHKHPQFISPVFSEGDAKVAAEVWSSSSPANAH